MKKHVTLLAALLLCIVLGADHAYAQGAKDPFPTVNWVGKATNTSSGATFANTTTDAAGNVYVCGSLQGSITLDSGKSTAQVVTASHGQIDILVAKYNAAGTLAWAFSIGSAYSDYARAIAVDDNGYVYITGAVTASNITAVNLSPGGTGNVFGVTATLGTNLVIAKYNGNLLPTDPAFYKWGTLLGGSAKNGGTNIGNDIAVDHNGYVYVGGAVFGNINTTIKMDPSGANLLHGSSLYTPLERETFVVAKYDGSLTPTDPAFYKWGFVVGNDYDAQIDDIAVDNDGYVYIQGLTTSTQTIDMNPATGSSDTTKVTGQGGGGDIVIAKYNGQLTPADPAFCKWAFALGGVNSDATGDITVGPNSQVYITENITGAVDMDPNNTGTHVVTGLSQSNMDMVVAKYNGLLTPADPAFYQWAFVNTGNANSFSTANGIAIDSSNNIYITGSIGDYSIFTPGAVPTPVSMDPSGKIPGLVGSSQAGFYTDVFIVKYNGALSPSDTSFYKWAFNIRGNDPTKYFSQGTGISYGNNTFSVIGAFATGSDHMDFQPGSDSFNVVGPDGTSVFQSGFVATYSLITPATVTTGTISGSSFCAGDTLSVPYTITGTFSAGNIFTAQLSDASGSFTSPVSIGTLTSTTSDTIKATIPANTASGAAYRIRVISSNPVLTGAINTVDLAINATVIPSVSIAVSPNDTICAGASVTFTATPTNEGPAPVYQWKDGITNVGTGTATYTDNGLANGDAITLTMTSNAACANTAPVLSNTITMTVDSVLIPSVTVVANLGDTICAGTAVTFTATPVNPGLAPQYQWMNGATTVGGNTTTYTDNNFADGDAITLTMTSNAVCASTAPVVSTPITMTVTQPVTPNVSISASPGDTICSGTMVLFTATGANGGTAPIYQWRKNGVTVGGNSTAYNDNVINNDVVLCIIASSLNCVTQTKDTSNEITMTVNSAIAPTVSIAATPGTTVSAGTTVTFRATVSNAGTTPDFQWQKNGIDVGSNSNVYNENNLLSGDKITCIVHSSLTCADPDSTISNELLMKITTGVNEVATANNITLFPNPNNGSFNIEGKVATDDKEVQLEIWNVVGQLVYHATVPVQNGVVKEQLQLPGTNTNGIYMLRIKTDSGDSLLRFVINK